MPNATLSHRSARTPLAERVADGLTQRAQNGGFGHGLRFPSEREIAQEFGVSRTVVRQALDILEARKLIERAQSRRPVLAPPVHGHRRTSGRMTLGVWLSNSPSDQGIAALIGGIHQALDPSAHRIIIGSPTWYQWEDVVSSEIHFFEQLIEDQDVAGALISHSGAPESLPALQRLVDTGIPLVFLDRPPLGTAAHLVGVNNRQATERLLRHLTDLGHRRIAHITNDDPGFTVRDRFLGYRRALATAGIAFDPDLVSHAGIASDADADSVYGAQIDTWCALPEPPTAVFAVNDLTAQRFRQVAQRRGIRIPEGISLTGFDGTEGWNRRTPFLTTVRQPFDQIGEQAAALLLQVMDSPQHPFLHLILDATLEVHASTAPPAIIATTVP